MNRFAALIIGLVILAGPAAAVLPSEELREPGLEARARKIGSELRCLVCQNQTIDDSDAPLAGDLRVLLRERLVAGDSDRQARNFIVARYGNFVLLKPPFDTQTLLLWLGPAFVLVGGGAWASWKVWRRAPDDSSALALTGEEQAALRRRLESDGRQ